MNGAYRETSLGKKKHASEVPNIVLGSVYYYLYRLVNCINIFILKHYENPTLIKNKDEPQILSESVGLDTANKMRTNF